MNVLVTGANGFLGSAVVARVLSRPEARVRCLVRPGSDVSKLRPVIDRWGDRVEIVRGTLSNPADCLHALDGIAVVQHLAAALRGAAADMFLNSVVATKNLLEAMVRTGRRPKLVHCSSFGVYGVADLPRGAVIDETTPPEPHPERRDLYSHSKHRQERLVWEYSERHALPVVVLRPGVIYGPGGGAISNRVGLELFGMFLKLGGRNPLPLTYVDNCAEAFALAGDHPRAVGSVFNVVDDDPVTAAAFLRRYQREVRKLRVVSLPYPVLMALSRAVSWYSEFSGGQLPAIFTPYKTATLWKGNRFDNSKLKGLGYEQPVSTERGLSLHFTALRQQEHGAANVPAEAPARPKLQAIAGRSAPRRTSAAGGLRQVAPRRAALR